MTPEGRDSTARGWAADRGIQYAPSLVLFYKDDLEVFNTEAYLRSFHVPGPSTTSCPAHIGKGTNFRAIFSGWKLRGSGRICGSQHAADLWPSLPAHETPESRGR